MPHRCKNVDLVNLKIKKTLKTRLYEKTTKTLKTLFVKLLIKNYQLNQNVRGSVVRVRL